LVAERNDLDLDAALRRSAWRTTAARPQEKLQTGSAGQPEERSEPFFLARGVGIRVGKGGVTPTPAKLETSSVALH